jgi:hypothetical protein
VKNLTTAALLLTATTLNSGASILYTFSESSEGVQLAYTGSLRTSALSFQGTLSSAVPRNFISFNGNSPWTGGLYDFQNVRPSLLKPEYPGPYVRYRFMAENTSFSWNLCALANYYEGSSTYGDTFGFYLYQQMDGSYTTWMYLPYRYISETTFSGGMFFAGQTLSSMGLEPGESFQVFLPENEIISGSVVPEPQSICFIVLAGLGIYHSARSPQQIRRSERGIEAQGVQKPTAR